jgi:hypothetical protein
LESSFTASLPDNAPLSTSFDERVVTGVQVEPDHTPGRANPLRSNSGDDAGAASNVQDVLARPWVCQRHHQRRPGSEHGGNQYAFIDLSGMIGNLAIHLAYSWTPSRIRSVRGTSNCILFSIPCQVGAIRQRNALLPVYSKKRRVRGKRIRRRRRQGRQSFAIAYRQRPQIEVAHFSGRLFERGI